MAKAHSLQRVWMNLSAFPLVLDVQGLVRQALAYALEKYAGPLSLITRRHSMP